MKRISTFFLAIVLVLCLTGCSYRQSISELSIAQGVGVDSENGNTVISVQYLDLSKGTGTTDNLDSSITSVISGEGESIGESISNASASVSSSIFFGQNKIIALGMDYAKNNMSHYLDYTIRGVDSRPDVLVAVCGTKGADLINSKLNNQKVPAQALCDMIKTGERVGLSAVVTTNDLLNYSSSKTSDIFLPCLEVADKKAYCSGVAIFSNNEYVTTLNSNETLGLSLIRGKIEGATITINDESLGAVGVEILKECSCISVSFKSTLPCLCVSIKAKASVCDTENGIAVKVSQSDISRLENEINKELKSICEGTISKCFSSKVDAFRFGNALAKSYPTAYDELKDNWRELLPSCSYTVSVNTNLQGVSDNLLRE